MIVVPGEPLGGHNLTVNSQNISMPEKISEILMAVDVIHVSQMPGSSSRSWMRPPCCCGNFRRPRMSVWVPSHPPTWSACWPPVPGKWSWVWSPLFILSPPSFMGPVGSYAVDSGRWSVPTFDLYFSSHSWEGIRESGTPGQSGYARWREQRVWDQEGYGDFTALWWTGGESHRPHYRSAPWYPHTWARMDGHTYAHLWSVHSFLWAKP